MATVPKSGQNSFLFLKDPSVSPCVCVRPEDVEIKRPFYPQGQGPSAGP